jgi:CO dehydrogenase/acetyl-CoA synthase gamma subunit (corrinoid Fe-S protein)
MLNTEKKQKKAAEQAKQLIIRAKLAELFTEEHHLEESASMVKELVNASVMHMILDAETAPSPESLKFLVDLQSLLTSLVLMKGDQVMKLSCFNSTELVKRFIENTKEMNRADATRTNS